MTQRTWTVSEDDVFIYIPGTAGQYVRINPLKPHSVACPYCWRENIEYEHIQTCQTQKLGVS